MANSIVRSALYFGKVITSDLPQAIKVSVPKYVLDTRLTMYFKEKEEVYAFDKKNECSEGDYVLIRKLPEDTYPEGFPIAGKKIEYDVEKLVHRQEAWIDPVSGKRVGGIEFLDDIKRTCELFGRLRPYQKSSNESK